MSLLVELDSRRRTSLAKVGRPEHRLYLATDAPDGTITLTPAVVMPEAEVRALEERLNRNTDLVAEIDANRADPSRLRPRRKRPPVEHDDT